MAEGGDFDDLEMKELKPERPDPEEDSGDEDEDDTEDDTEDDDSVVTIKRPTGDPPEVRKDVGDIRRSMTLKRKDFFEKNLKVEIRAADGRDSAELLRRTKILYDKRDRPRGLSLDGIEVLVGTEESGFRESKRSRRKVMEYKRLLEGARQEHRIVEEMRRRIASQARKRVDDLVETREDSLENESEEVHLTEQDIREFAGVLNPRGTDAEKIEALEMSAEHFRMKALREADPTKEAFYRSVSETAELKADSIRLRIGLDPEHDEANSIVAEEINNDDLGRLERFKRWARENLFGLSAVAISVARIITAVVASTRKVVVAGAKATSKFAKALAKLATEQGTLRVLGVRDNHYTTETTS